VENFTSRLKLGSLSCPAIEYSGAAIGEADNSLKSPKTFLYWIDDLEV
jgi:hypothetical protein